MCQAESCWLIFTESEWYRDLIERHRGRNNRAPIVLWPYPIEPKPGGPLPAEYDLLVYAKGRYSEGFVERLMQRFERVRRLIYGRFARRELFEAARRSRCCLYLSDDDRGPLALAEILLAGCPAIGVPTGAPFIEHGRTGMMLSRFCLSKCRAAVARCHELDRRNVAALAAEQFDTDRIVQTVLTALDKVAFSMGGTHVADQPESKENRDGRVRGTRDLPVATKTDGDRGQKGVSWSTIR